MPLQSCSWWRNKAPPPQPKEAQCPQRQVNSSSLPLVGVLVLELDQTYELAPLHGLLKPRRTHVTMTVHLCVLSMLPLLLQPQLPVLASSPITGTLFSYWWLTSAVLRSLLEDFSVTWLASVLSLASQGLDWRSGNVPLARFSVTDDWLHQYFARPFTFRGIDWRSGNVSLARFSVTSNWLHSFHLLLKDSTDAVVTSHWHAFQWWRSDGGLTSVRSILKDSTEAVVTSQPSRHVLLGN